MKNLMKRTTSLALAFVPLLLAAPVGADVGSVPQPVTVIENAEFINVTAVSITPAAGCYLTTSAKPSAISPIRVSPPSFAAS